MTEPWHPRSLEAAQEQLKKQRAREMHQRIADLFLHSGQTPEEIATLLGAEAYLEVIPTKKRGAEPIKRFAAKEFVHQAVEQDEYLRLPVKVENFTSLLVEPGPATHTKGGQSAMEQAFEQRPRMRAIMEVMTALETDYSILFESIRSTATKLVRRVPYYFIHVPQYQKLIIACEQVGNATYIIFNVAGASDQQAFIGKRKEELDALIETRVDKRSSVPEMNDWKKNLTESIVATKPRPANWRPTEKPALLKADLHWVTKVDAVAEIANIKNKNWLDTRIARYHLREKHPEWIEERINKSGGVSEHYHRELIAFLKAKYELLRQTKRKNELTTILGITPGSEWAVERTEQYRAEFPHYFVVDLIDADTGEQEEYIHNDLIALLKKRLATCEFVPQAGWYGIASLSTEFNRRTGFGTGKYSEWVVSRLNQYASQGEAYSKKFRKMTGYKEVFYSEIMLTALVNEFGELAPDNWYTLRALSLRLGISTFILGKYWEQVRDAMTEPERQANFHHYRTRTSQLVECCNDEVAHRIEELYTTPKNTL